MGKESFILYLEQQEVFEMLSDEEAGKLIKNKEISVAEITKAALEKKEKIINKKKELKNEIIKIKSSLDRNKEKYNKVVERNKKNIEKRWKKENTKNTTGKNGINTNTKNTDNDNDSDNVNDNDNEDIDNNILAPEDENFKAPVKASKHKYGEFKNVLLKDEELQNLKEQYQNWEELIKYLDEYIEMKGYKAKSHYLCIKKWVVDAVKKQKANNNTAKNKTAMEEFLNG